MDENILRRWRLILGKDAEKELGIKLNRQSLRMDSALEAVYGARKRSGGMEASAPKAARWLGDVRGLFPESVVHLIQQDAIERMGLRWILNEREVLESVVPDVHLVSALLSLRYAIPEENREVARSLVNRLVQELLRKITAPMRQSVQGALSRSYKRCHPRHNEIDWSTTILKNLRHYQPDYKTIIPEVLYGHGRLRRGVKDIILCLDQSGSMSESVVYASIYGAVLASIPALSTRLIAFDTSVVDLSDDLSDPVDLLFGIQLGGGTDIDQALRYCQEQMQRPKDTILILITDLYEGGNENDMRARFKAIKDAGVQVVVLLALSDEGAPSYDREQASFLSSLGIPCFACTPDKFPELMGAAISQQDLGLWASEHLHRSS